MSSSFPAEGSPRREQVDSGNAAELASCFVEKGSRSACSPSEHVDIFWLVLRVDAELAELDDCGPAPADRVGRERQHDGIPFALRSGLPSRRTR
jgi:hypothetical protein